MVSFTARCGGPEGNPLRLRAAAVKIKIALQLNNLKNGSF